MTFNELRRRFPNASLDCLRRSAQDSMEVTDVKAIVKEMKCRLRQDHKPLLNKLEARWLERLKADYPCETFLAQSIRFKLANGVWYKPDFFCWAHGWPEEEAKWKRFRSTAWEVKGPKSWRGGFENLKIAASTYPNIRWVLVWDDYGWNEQEVIP
jgi:hypothetical protein